MQRTQINIPQIFWITARFSRPFDVRNIVVLMFNVFIILRAKPFGSIPIWDVDADDSKMVSTVAQKARINSDYSEAVHVEENQASWWQ